MKTDYRNKQLKANAALLIVLAGGNDRFQVSHTATRATLKRQCKERWGPGTLRFGPRSVCFYFQDDEDEARDD